METSIQKQNSDEIYSGRQELEAMKLAENYNNFIVDLIAKHLGEKRTIVDFGAGNGLFAEKVKNRGNQVNCVEIDEPLIQEISSKGLPVEKSILNYPPQQYLYSLNVLEHIHDDVGTLKMIYSQLQPNSKIFLYVPAFQILFSANDKRVGHVRRYRKSELRSKLSEAGFQVVETGYVDTVGFFATLAYKLIGSKSGEINTGSLVFFDRFLFPLNKVLDPIFGSFLGKNTFAVAVKK